MGVTSYSQTPSVLKKQLCQGSELLLGKDIWTDSQESMPMPLGLRIMQLGLEQPT